jgi:Ca-activated chloride channel family protein
MPLPPELQLPIAAAAGILLLVLVAEKFHERRAKVVAYLATGPRGRPRAWVRWAPVTRAVALSVMAWALTTLYFTHGAAYLRSDDAADRREAARHLVFIADLSPSMQLKDAGPGGDQMRAARMYDVVDALLQRIEGDVVYSVIGFYTDAMPVILDAKDTNLVRNVFNGLPMWYAMEAGKTDLGTGVRKSLEHLIRYTKASATVFICTDGDTIELGAIPKTPPSVRKVYVLGVGDPHQGTFIDDHMSRQDAAMLGTLAGRLRGQYIDVNEKHVPTPSLGALALGAGTEKRRYGLADYAIAAFAAAATVLAVIPLLLEYAGSDWKAVRVARAEIP